MATEVFDESVRTFEVDDPIWIHWTNETTRGWITSVVSVPYFHARDDGVTHFRMYGTLEKGGRSFERVAARLLAHREVEE